MNLLRVNGKLREKADPRLIQRVQFPHMQSNFLMTIGYKCYLQAPSASPSLLTPFAPTFLGLISEMNQQQNDAVVRQITGIAWKMGNTTFVSACNTQLIRVKQLLTGMAFVFPGVPVCTLITAGIIPGLKSCEGFQQCLCFAMG